MIGEIDTFSAQGILNDFLKKEMEEGKGYKAKHFHASDLGQCRRKTILKRCNVKPTNPLTPRNLRVFSCGHIFHEWIGDKLEKAGVLISKEQTIENEKYNYKGRYDALIEKDGVRLLYEFKSQHSNSFHWIQKRGGANEMHKMQIASYALMGDLKVKECRILYISKDDLCLAEYPVFVKDYKDEVIEELEFLNHCYKNKKIPEKLPETITQFGKTSPNWQCRFCSYLDKCRGKGWETKMKKKIKINKFKKGRKYKITKPEYK